MEPLRAANLAAYHSVYIMLVLVIHCEPPGSVQVELGHDFVSDVSPSIAIFCVVPLNIELVEILPDLATFFPVPSYTSNS